MHAIQLCETPYDIVISGHFQSQLLSTVMSCHIVKQLALQIKGPGSDLTCC